MNLETDFRVNLLLQALIKKKQRQMSSSNLVVTVGQRHGDVP